MSIRGKFLAPVARLAGRHAGQQLARFLRACRDCRLTQDRLLGELVASAARSDFGRDHGLGAVRDYGDFVRAVPLGDYAALSPYLQQVLAGRSEAMFEPGRAVRMFAVTSGTTGQPKYIPVTDRFLDDYHRGWNIFGIKSLQDHRAGWLRPIVTIASSACESRSPAGLPCGAISGLLAQRQKWIVRRMYPVPAAAREIRDSATKFYAILRCAIGRDVGMLTTANPSSLVKLAQAGMEQPERLIRDVRDGTFTPPGELPPALAGKMRFRPNERLARRLEDILRREGRLAPRHYWKPAIITCWTGGTVSLYLPQVRELYGEVPIRDIGLLASEGRLSLPLEDDTPAGLAEITGNFLEFIPAGAAGQSSPPVLRADELELGEEYFVVLTNWAGLWRYQIGDRVRVVGKVGSCPVYEFLSRGLHTSSITGEKLTEHQVVQAMRIACRQLGAGIELFEMQGHFAPVPYYLLRVELPGRVEASALSASMDSALRSQNTEYNSKRGDGRLGPIRLEALPGGHFARNEERLVRKLGRGEQYKHRYLLSDIITD